ncbi:hypothetical protein [Mycolicibacterium vinylchloridicum]|uniref:hypothetical protein n=1 Tax=Mycolicibacterium vinylchloridicum TaxID=2736928 RepID=UPI0009DB4EFF|nr:hypothetical protein [Mycolicibacterium vinylchloridicum]
MDQTVRARVAQMQEASAQLAAADAPRGSARRVRQAIDRVSAAVSEMGDDAAALHEAAMYWVSRDMVGVVHDAAAGLPEWTPAAAVPASTGLLCWARPIGDVPYGPGAESGGGHSVPWDAVFWRTRSDGLMQLVPASRLAHDSGLETPLEMWSPVYPAHSILLNPNHPRTQEVEGDPAAQPFVSIVGAAWLLMSQANVSTLRSIDSGAAPGTEDKSADRDTDRSAGELGPVSDPRRPQPPSTVTLVELRPRTASGDKASRGSRSRTDARTHRWPVAPFWRQQACGPGRSQRKPVYVVEHERGPRDAPLLPKDRVHVLRR